MSPIRFKSGIDILLSLVHEGYATESVLVVCVGVHDRYFIPAFLQIGLPQHHEVFGGLRHQFDRINDDLLDQVAFEIQLQSIEIEIVKVESDLGQTEIFIRHYDQVVVVGDAVVPQDLVTLVCRVLVQTHHGNKPIKDIKIDFYLYRIYYRPNHQKIY